MDSEKNGNQAQPLPDGSGLRASIVSSTFVDETSSTEELPSGFTEGVRSLESILGMPVWLLVHGIAYDAADEDLYNEYFAQREELPKSQPIALLIHSLGGSATVAYKLANLIRKRCGDFVAVVPKYAKSAATLLTLGASEIVLDKYAELGPIDIWIRNEKTDVMESALNYAQALGRLGDDTETIMWEVAINIAKVTGKPMVQCLQPATDYATSLVTPLVGGMDVAKYTEMLRTLKIGEEYATRLLSAKYDREKAAEIAEALVSHYPDHEFVIDIAEAQSLGLAVEEPPDEIVEVNKKIIPYLDGRVTALGRLEEIES